MTENKGHCPHGEFDLLEGCPQCIAERRQQGISPEQDEIEDGLDSEGLTLAKPQIVKVRYYSDDGRLSDRPYTYYSNDSLKVGDIVIVPIRDTTGKAQVSAINVPEVEITAFKDKVKTIPSGSIQAEDTFEQMEQEADESMDAMEKEIDAAADAECAEAEANLTALILRPGEDIEAHGYFDEARKMLVYAERRVIKTLEDAKLATDDLSLISRLKKAMEAKRKEKLAPHEAEVNAIRDTYNYLMLPVLEAERITKTKQTAFLQDQERVRREQEEINRKRMEVAQQEMQLKGELTESVNLVEVNEAPARVSSSMGSSGLTDHWIYEVVDILAVPREYLVVDSAMLTAIAKKHHDQKPVAGIRFINKPYLATRTK